MSKALVIKGANFSANKVETVTIGESVPCTGISLSESSVAFDTLNETATLVATLVPANTTDILSWISSDENVATVADGVVTCVGVGSATITATCGTQTATCSVNSIITIDLAEMYTFDPSYSYSGSIELPNKDWIGYDTSQAYRWRTYYNEGDTLGGYRAFYNASYAGKYLMPIPTGATKVASTTPTGASGVKLILANSATKSKASGADGECAAAVANIQIATQTPVDISSYSADGFVIYVTTTAADVSTLSGHPVLTFT